MLTALLLGTMGNGQGFLLMGIKSADVLLQFDRVANRYAVEWPSGHISIRCFMSSRVNIMVTVLTKGVLQILPWPLETPFPQLLWSLVG